MLMNVNTLCTIISIIVECILLIYYCDSTMEYRTSRIKSNIIIIIGYCVYCVICLFGVTLFNITGFFIMSFGVLTLAYKDSIKSIVFKVAILTALMMFSELVASLLINTELTNEFMSVTTFIENIIFFLFSKFIYSIFVIIFKHLSVYREHRYQDKEMIALILLPILTCMYLYLFNKINALIPKNIEIPFVVFSLLLILTNFVVYAVCERIIDKNIQIQQLKNVEHKIEIDEKSYQLIKEKYEDMRIMAHDFNKYYSYIETIINDNRNDVTALTQELKNKNKELLMVEYTNNKTLNVLLAQKIKECKDFGIDFELSIHHIDISFINESNTIAIFANLLDNAIESCKSSVKKKILLNINTMNNSFLVIRSDNSADTEPIVNDGKLCTIKSDKDNHGIGMISIKKALENYNGKIQWSYDVDKGVFNTTILVSFKKFIRIN